jgi:HNH endonuclease
VTPKRPRRKAVELDPAQHAKNVKYGRRWQLISDQVLRQAGYRCAIKLAGVCTGRADVADHIVPLEDGGMSVMENAQAACRPCNQAKGYLQRIERAGPGGGVRVSGDPQYPVFPPRWELPTESCPHRLPDGSWCPGLPGHWSRWWGMEPPEGATDYVEEEHR